MNYICILEIAKKRLINENMYIVDDINQCIQSGSTGGEITSIVGSYLLNLKAKNFKAYQLMEDEINKFLRESKNNGLDII
ncbi:MAG: hypothetical protein R2774_01495 [Saprospiraceae bacterium]